MRRAFSLVELIVSMALLGILGTAVLMFIVSTARPTRELARREFAVQLASSRLESLRSRPLRELVTESSADSTGPDGTPYEVQTKVEAVPGFEASQLLHITVEVSWSAQGRRLFTEVQGYLSEFRY